MTHEQLVILVRVLAALIVGAAIGFERTFHGRPAGFRTHALVCLASSLLMLVTVYQNEWMTVMPLDAIRTDPTRMAQGIMTGIGFLGAGVIFKEGLTVRGLTTAASIWITAAIGVLIGIGFHYAATLGAVATIAVLSAFRPLKSPPGAPAALMPSDVLGLALVFAAACLFHPSVRQRFAGTATAS